MSFITLLLDVTISSVRQYFIFIINHNHNNNNERIIVLSSLHDTSQTKNPGPRHQHHHRYWHPEPGCLNSIQLPVSSLLLLALEHCSLSPQHLSFSPESCPSPSVSSRHHPCGDHHC